MSVYPPNIAQKFEYKEFDKQKTASLKKQFSKNTLICVYGLAGVGKGTVSKKIAQSLDITHFDSGLIHRSITYAYLDTGLECTPETISQIVNLLDIKLNSTGLEISYNGKTLTIPDLREPRISSNVARFASKDWEQLAFFELMYEILSHYGKPVVLDGRGGNPPHVKKLEDEGWKIIRILLEVSDEVNFERYYLAYLQKQLSKNIDFKETPELKEKVFSEFNESFLARNKIDIEWMQRMDIGFIVENSALIDNSVLTMGQALDTALNYIGSQM
ncbi:MAG: (d)CMP kinase [bacterium]